MYAPEQFACVQAKTQGNACATEGGKCVCPGGKVDFGTYGDFDGQDSGDGYWTNQIAGTATITCNKATFTDWNTKIPEPHRSSPQKGCRCHPTTNPWDAVTKAEAKPALCAGAKTDYVKPKCIHVGFTVYNNDGYTGEGSGGGKLNTTEWMAIRHNRFLYEMVMLGALGQVHKEKHARNCNFYKPSITTKVTATEFQAFSVAIAGAATPNVSLDPGWNGQDTTRLLQFGAQVQVPDAYEGLKMWDELVYQNYLSSLPPLSSEIGPDGKKLDSNTAKPAASRMVDSCWTKAVRTFTNSVAYNNKCTFESAANKLFNQNLAAGVEKMTTFCYPGFAQESKAESTRTGLMQGWKPLASFFSPLPAAVESKGDCPLATTATTTVTTTTTSTTTTTKIGTTPNPGNKKSGSVGGSTLPPSQAAAVVASNAQSLAWSLVSASCLLLAILGGVSQ
jgi:hypothetical protein